jgi:stage II sporulation protein D
VINQINLEDYLKGILYQESSHYWPQEALKAQAAVCRSYAVYQIEENKLKDYDVTSDIYSQVYGGKTSERYRTNRAVDDTRSQVITYKDKIIPAYFHATCAGHTEDAGLLWNIEILPLKGVVCGFCKASPHFNWHNVLSLSEIEEKLTAAGYKIKGIEGITILGRNESGRILDLEIASAQKNIKISAKDFRNLIGPNLIRSTNFRVSIAQGDAVFEGLGWGHGVGLCQWGAYFMAKQGYTYKEILRYYYPQTDVKTLRF